MKYTTIYKHYDIDESPYTDLQGLLFLAGGQWSTGSAQVILRPQSSEVKKDVQKKINSVRTVHRRRG